MEALFTSISSNPFFCKKKPQKMFLLCTKSSHLTLPFFSKYIVTHSFHVHSAQFFFWRKRVFMFVTEPSKKKSIKSFSAASIWCSCVSPVIYADVLFLVHASCDSRTKKKIVANSNSMTQNQHLTGMTNG
jgi:hypothetical protein